MELVSPLRPSSLSPIWFDVKSLIDNARVVLSRLLSDSLSSVLIALNLFSVAPILENESPAAAWLAHTLRAPVLFFFFNCEEDISEVPLSYTFC